MSRLLSKVDSKAVGDERVALLSQAYPDYEFEVNDAGDSRLEVNLIKIRVGVDVTEVQIASMKRIAAGLDTKVATDGATKVATKPVPPVMKPEIVRPQI